VIVLEFILLLVGWLIGMGNPGDTRGHPAGYCLVLMLVRCKPALSVGRWY